MEEEEEAVACVQIEGEFDARFVSGRFEGADSAASGRGPFGCAASLAAGSGELEVAEEVESAASGGELEAVVEAVVEDGESVALGSFDAALCGEFDSSAVVVEKARQAASDSTKTVSPISQTAVLELADEVYFDAAALAATKAVAAVVVFDEQAGIR